MLRWVRRIISVLLALFLSLWKFGVLHIILLILGIPGLIDDMGTWYRWINEVELAHPFYFIGMFVAVCIGTAEWWGPKVASAVRAPRTDELESGDEDQVQRFKDLVPKLECLADFCRPVDRLMLPAVTALDPYTSSSIRVRTESLEVRAVLDSLGIEYPATEFARGSEDWYHYATFMRELATQGKLTEAQSYRLDSA